jgi:hypothetical protein
LQVLQEKDIETAESLEALLAWTAQQETCFQEEILVHVRGIASHSKDEMDVTKAVSAVYQHATADLNRVCSTLSNGSTWIVIKITSTFSLHILRH